MRTSSDEYKAIVDNLSVLIYRHLSSAVAEQKFPRGGPDESESFIKEEKNRFKELRRIREEFENLMTGVIL